MYYVYSDFCRYIKIENKRLVIGEFLSCYCFKFCHRFYLKTNFVRQYVYIYDSDFILRMQLIITKG